MPAIHDRAKHTEPSSIVDSGSGDLGVSRNAEKIALMESSENRGMGDGNAMGIEPNRSGKLHRCEVHRHWLPFCGSNSWSRSLDVNTYSQD